MRFWWEREPPAWSLLLAPAAAAWRAGAALQRALARPVQAAVPVISVGNLAVGGTGKTPVALELAARLLRRGRKPAVLSRGYGRRSRAERRVAADARAEEVGDEPLLMARRGLTVWVGPRRAALAPRAVEQGADVLILDDGLQHHALARDLDVIVADASNLFGNGALLPRGPLRELPSALGRVRNGILWLTRCDLPRDPRVEALPDLPLVESAYQARADLRGRRVFLFAGIARPDGFVETVRGLGAEIAGTRWFRDHHLFSARELEELRAHAAGATLVTTEKDLARIEQPRGIVEVKVELRILRGEDALERALGAIL
ncbi:MAG TPA: tetraacyldisaccharide 4'-kinase [Myxococcales bacterium]|nr:tetraacyldisaccharide 4'-kinase [Myxococcales bacterium]